MGGQLFQQNRGWHLERDAGRRDKIAASKRCKKRPPRVIEAMRQVMSAASDSDARM
jgi:hypothetical protein